MADQLTMIVDAISELLTRVLPGESRRRRREEPPKPSELPGSNMAADEIQAARRREQEHRDAR